MKNPTPLRPTPSRAAASALLAALGLLAVALGSGPASASSKDEQSLRDGCTWLDRALTREPDRDDAFGMFMRGLMPKCQALLEGLARGDKSVRPEGMKAVINEIAQLQAVIDEEHGGPPPATGRPTPDEVAKQRVADEKAGVDAEAKKKAEAERQAAEEAKRVEAEKKAAEEEAKRKEAEAKAAAEAERRLAEQRAKETEKERKAREAEEKKAEAARKREEERVRKEMAAAEKKAAEEARRAEAERVKAEKKAAEEAKRAEAERLKADRAAAAELEQEAARQKKEREAAEAEALRLMAEAEREAAEEARKNAREEAKSSAEEEARLRLANEQAEKARKAAEDEARAQAQARAKASRGKGGPLDGTWEQPPSRSLDRNIKRSLNIFTKDGKVQGELYEEVWYPAPSSWVDRSCEGNTTFRMVTSARVTGEAGKNKLVLWRDVPRVLTCTCPSRCTVETRRRGFDLEVSPDGRELSDSSGVFVRPGTVIVGSAKQAESEATPGPVVTATPKSFVGAWETAPFKRRDETVVMRLELSLDGDKLKGMLVERSSQGLPLQSWSERFCGGATRWEWVAKWEIEGESKGKNLSLRGMGGDNLTCSCPSKCKKPKDKIVLSGSLGATGSSISLGGDLYEKK